MPRLTLRSVRLRPTDALQQHRVLHRAGRPGRGRAAGAAGHRPRVAPERPRPAHRPLQRLRPHRRCAPPCCAGKCTMCMRNAEQRSVWAVTPSHRIVSAPSAASPVRPPCCRSNRHVRTRVPAQCVDLGGPDGAMGSVSTPSCMKTCPYNNCGEHSVHVSLQGRLRMCRVAPRKRSHSDRRFPYGYLCYDFAPVTKQPFISSFLLNF